MKNLRNTIFAIMVVSMMLVSVTTVIAEDSQYKETIIAEPTASAILVNGKAVELEAYTIDSNNYFKLRDIAFLVTDSQKKFEVTWDQERKAINLISDKAYTEVGGEIVKGDGKTKQAELNRSTVYKDGRVINLRAYTINSNNYFKLRDLARAFDIGVTWDGKTNTVGIDTSISYVDEEEKTPAENINLFEQEESEALYYIAASYGSFDMVDNYKFGVDTDSKALIVSFGEGEFAPQGEIYVVINNEDLKYKNLSFDAWIEEMGAAGLGEFALYRRYGDGQGMNTDIEIGSALQKGERSNFKFNIGDVKEIWIYTSLSSGSEIGLSNIHLDK